MQIATPFGILLTISSAHSISLSLILIHPQTALQHAMHLHVSQNHLLHIYILVLVNKQETTERLVDNCA